MQPADLNDSMALGRRTSPPCDQDRQGELGLQNAGCILANLAPSLAATVAEAAGQIPGLTTVITSNVALIDDDRLSQPGCVVAVLAGNGAEAIKLSRSLADRMSPLKVVLLGLQPPINDVIKAMRGGAFDILSWPSEADRLASTLDAACRASIQERIELDRCRQAREQLALLTDSECEVVDLMLAGMPNKRIAARLDLALRTVELRRQEIFGKLHTRNVTDIFLMIHAANRNFIDIGSPQHALHRPRFLPSGSTSAPTIADRPAGA